MSGNIHPLPVWKENATAEERFLELAHMARKWPERFAKVGIVYEETLPDGCTQVRDMSYGCSTVELIGLFELGKGRVINRTER